MIYRTLFVATFIASAGVLPARPAGGEDCAFPTFELVYRLPCSSPRQIVAADIDGDGLDDLLVSRPSEAVIDVYGNSGARFDLAQTLTWNGLSTATMTTGDWNGDGHVDLFFGSSYPHAMHIALNDGTGAFVDHLTVPLAFHLSSAATHDVDGNGRDDLLVIVVGDSERDRILRFESTDDGGVADSEITTARYRPHVLALNDVDCDGDTDIVVSYGDIAQAQVLRNDGNGDFVLSNTLAIEREHANIVLHDVSGDGAAELFTSNPPIWYINDGHGFFEQAGTFDDPGYAPLHLWNITVGAFNASHAPLVIGANYGLRLYEAGQPGKTEKSLRLVPSEFTSYYAKYATGDFDHFSGTDLVVAVTVYGDPYLHLYANHGTQLDCNNNGNPDGCDLAGDMAADCNLDGMIDACAIASGVNHDCDENGVPDDCQTDCNLNGVLDSCDLASGSGTDYDSNGVLDQCEFLDRNRDGINDIVQCALGAVDDCNSNFVPDSVESLADGWGYDDGTADGIYYNMPAFDATIAVRFDAGDGQLVTGIAAATTDSTHEVGYPVHLFMWDDPNNDGQPDDAVLLTEHTVPIQVMNSSSHTDEPVFNRWPIDPVKVTGSFFIGFGVVPEDVDGFAVLIHDFDSYRHDQRTWYTKGVGGDVIRGAYPHPQELIAPLLRVVAADCNGDAIPDACDLNAGGLTDVNGDGVPDECDCFADLSHDSFVNEADLVTLTAEWGSCPDRTCPADFNRDGAIDVFDLLLLLQAWGLCPQ